MNKTFNQKKSILIIMSAVLIMLIFASMTANAEPDPEFQAISHDEYELIDGYINSNDGSYDYAVSNLDTANSDAAKVAAGIVGHDCAQGLNGYEMRYSDSPLYVDQPNFDHNQPLSVQAPGDVGYNQALEGFNGAKNSDGVVPIEVTFTQVYNPSSQDVKYQVVDDHSFQQLREGESVTVKGYQYIDNKGNLITVLNDNPNLDGKFKLASVVAFDKNGNPSAEFEANSSFLSTIFDNGKPGFQPTETVITLFDHKSEKPGGSNILGGVTTDAEWGSQHLTPSPKGEIKASDSNKVKYNCEVAIPTSENLDYYLHSDDILYDIHTQLQHPGAHTNGVLNLTGIGQIHYETYDHVGDEYMGVADNGEPIYRPIYEWRGHTMAAAKNEPYSNNDGGLGWEVDKSDIWGLDNGLVAAQQGTYILDPTTGAFISGGEMPYRGEAPGPQSVAAWGCNNSAPTYELRERNYGRSRVPTYQECLDMANNAIANLKAGVDARLAASWGFGGRCNYNFRGLVVTGGNGADSFNNQVDPSYRTLTGSLLNRFIPSNYPNGLYKGFSNVFYSGRAGNAGQKSFPGSCNDVIVHTPVVDYAIVESENFVNQKVNPDPNLLYLQLDNNFTVTIPNGGDYTAWQGYGNRQYNSYQGVNTNDVKTWGKIEDIKFPFDVYVMDSNFASNGKKYFLRKGTWLSESDITNAQVNHEGTANGITWRFTLPVWVKEGVYSGTNGIMTRVIAENAPSKDASLQQELANTQADHSKYIAIKYTPVEVIGKIYDLQINESTDDDWQGNVQSLGYTTGYVRAREFPFGRTKSVGTPKPSQNTNTAYQYAPKLGYTFVFNFKTKGRKSNRIDIKVADNGFFFASKDGQQVTPVDLYYRSDSGKYIQIATNNGNPKVAVTLNSKFMGVPPVEMSNSSRIYPKEGISAYNYNVKVNIGDISHLSLPHSLRLVYDNFSEYITENNGKGLYNTTLDNVANNALGAVTDYGFGDETGKDMVIGSVGHWYAGYALPSTTVAVTKGIDPEQADKAIKSNDMSVMYKNGYILVRFKITSQNEVNGQSSDYLLYKGPEMLNSLTEEEYTADEKDKNPPIPEGKSFNDPDVIWISTDGSPIIEKYIILPSGTPAKIPNDAIAIYETDYSTTTDSDSVINN